MSKKIPCSYINCSGRRKHYQSPEETRDHRLVEVPDDFPADGIMYCSIECATYAEYFHKQAKQEHDEIMQEIAPYSIEGDGQEHEEIMRIVRGEEE